jgi:hypothetical protein
VVFQNLREAREIFNAQKPVQAWPAHVAVDQQRLVPLFRVGDGKEQRHQRTAAGNPVIGMVSSGAGQSGILIDGARVSGDATLFDGSVVTSTGYSRLHLNCGARVDVGADSVVRVFADHLSLEGGSSEVQSASGYAIGARSLKIQPSDAVAVARVPVDDTQRVQVTAVGAPVNVWSKDGVLVARVLPEAPMSFLPQAVASSSFCSPGCVVNTSNTAFLVDGAGNRFFELHAARNVDLSKFIGVRAKVTGTIEPSPRSATAVAQIVNAGAAERIAGAGCSDAAARMDATSSASGFASASDATRPAAPSPGAPKAGIAPALIAGIVIVATAGGTIGGLAEAGTFSATGP